MSRHVLTRDTDDYEVVVGYDAPLETYFAIVRDNQIEREETERAERIAAGEQEDDDTPERDSIVLWKGTFAREITDARSLVSLVAPYAAITPELLERLAADRESERHEPTPLQRRMRDLLAGGGS